MDEASSLGSTMRVTVSNVLLVAFSLAITQPRAAENATGLYLLGIKTSMAGFVPPPGTYVTDIKTPIPATPAGRRPWEWRYAGPET